MACSLQENKEDFFKKTNRATKNPPKAQMALERRFINMSLRKSIMAQKYELFISFPAKLSSKIKHQRRNKSGQG